MAKKKTDEKQENPLNILEVKTSEGVLTPKDEVNSVSAIVDKLIMWNALIAKAEAVKLELEARLQQIALPEIESKGFNNIQYFGNTGYAMVYMANQLKLESYNLAEDVLTKDFVSNYIKSSTDPVYEPKEALKKVAIPLFLGEFETGDVSEVLKQYGLGDDKLLVAMKKLKGDYLKDKKLLKSLGIPKEKLDELIYKIQKRLSWKAIKDCLEQSGHKEADKLAAAMDNLRRAVIVKQTPKILVNYEENAE